MKLLKILQYDIKYGVIKKRSFYLLGVLIATISCVQLSNNLASLKLTENIHGNGSMIDYWIYLMQGKDDYEFSVGVFYEFPQLWILIYIFYLISTCMHPYTDLFGMGSQFIVRFRSRETWWVSKSIWIMLSSLLYFFVIFFSIILFSFAFKIPITFNPTWYVMEGFGNQGFSDCNIVELFVIVLFQPVLLAGTLGMMQMFFSLKLHPLISFSICSSLLIISTYKRSYFLVGNLGMPLRMSKIAGEGLSMGVSISLLISILIVCFLGGITAMRRKDIF